MKRIYLDYAATTPCDPLVLKAMEPYFLEEFGNASSIHSYGQQAKKGIEQARIALAGLIGALPQEIVFTSGGTESNNTAIIGAAHAFERQKKGNHIIVSAVEHHAVSEPAAHLASRGFKVTTVGVDKYGLVDPADIKKAITDKTVLISVMHANNEIGTIQPIREIGAIAREKGVCMHTDAVQTVGHIPIDVADLNVDMLSLSAHKFYGPKGVGALYVKKGTRIDRFLHGGDQEQGRRASTYNTPGIVGLGKAAELCREKMEQEAIAQSGLRDWMIKELTSLIPESILNGHPALRLPNNVNISIKYIEGEAMLLNLDMLGIAASTGSACTSSSLEPSHVLLAIGLSHEVAHGSLRFSLGRWSTREDAEAVVKTLPKIVHTLRQMSPLYEQKP